MARAPALYRVSRWLGRVGVIVLVVILSYVALTIYSASQLSVGTGGSSSSTVSQNVVTVTHQLSLQNRGPLAITGVTITSVIRYPDGTLLGVARSPATEVPPGTNESLPIDIQIPLAAGSEASLLLTHSVTLPAETSANVTFGGIVTVRVVDTSGIDWGAPFDSLNVSVGTPTVEPNGTVVVPLTVSFTNRASFDDTGQLTYTLRSSTGMTCATGSLSLQVPSNQGYNQPTTVDLAPSCDPAGGTVDLVYTGGGLSLALPGEAIP